MSQLGTKKSRNGCTRCKKRRVKCDELAPCGNCVRRNEECSLLEPTPRSSADIIEPGLPANEEEWIQDLELMHFYIVRTSYEPLGLREAAQYLWREYIMQQALRHNFLMHGLLALSALHIAYLRRDERAKYLRLCDKHQSIALMKFRNILSSEIQQELAEALFALATALSLSSQARSCAIAGEMVAPGAITMDQVTELFVLARGVRDVIVLFRDQIRAGPMGDLLADHFYPERIEVKLPDSVAHQFTLLRRMVLEFDQDMETSRHCGTALSELERVYRNLAYWSVSGLADTEAVWRWTTFISTEYVRLIEARYAPALIVLAYFAAATTAARTPWYTHNWGQYAIEGVSREIDPSMHHWIEWPMQHSQSCMTVLWDQDLTVGAGVLNSQKPGFQ